MDRLPEESHVGMVNSANSRPPSPGVPSHGHERPCPPFPCSLGQSEAEGAVCCGLPAEKVTLAPPLPQDPGSPPPWPLRTGHHPRGGHPVSPSWADGLPRDPRKEQETRRYWPPTACRWRLRNVTAGDPVPCRETAAASSMKVIFRGSCCGSVD